MRVYVHRNLNRKCWSLLKGGRLQGYRREITLRDAEFRVRQSGYARYLREARRNVHAFVVGTVGRGTPQGRGTRIRYDLGGGEFVGLKGKTYSGANMVRLDREGRVWAYGPRDKEDIKPI